MANFFTLSMTKTQYQMLGPVSEPIPFRVNAMLGTWQPDPTYSGAVRIMIAAEGIPANVVMVYDQWGVPKPDFTLMMFNGQVEGKAAFQPTGPSNISDPTYTDVALKAVEVSGQIQGGNSNSCRLILQYVPPPPMDTVILTNGSVTLFSGTVPKPADLRLTLNGAVLFPYSPLTGAR